MRNRVSRMLANLHGRQGVNAMPADRSLYNYVIYDSDNERRFAHELDVCDKIAVYRESTVDSPCPQKRNSP